MSLDLSASQDNINPTNDPQKEIMVNLGASMEFKQISTLQDTFRNMLMQPDCCVIFEAGEVEIINTASVQLLICFMQTGNKQGLKFQWRSISPTFQEYVSLLGLNAVLFL